MASITIRTLARHLGLSKSTVAGALRGQSGYSPSTIAKVREAANELGYRPNPLVTACMARVRDGGRVGSAQTFAYLSDIPWRLLSNQSGLMNSYLGAKARAAELGFSLDYFGPLGKQVSATRLQSILQTRGITGLILAPTEQSRVAFDLQWELFSTVCIGWQIQFPRFDRVSYDYCEAVNEVCDRLHKSGYRRPGLVITENSDSGAENAARSGFLRWQADAVSNANAVPVSFAMSVTQLKRWEETHQPDCVIAFDRSALDVLQQVVGVDQEIVSLSLTHGFEHFGGFDMSPEFISARAVELLANKLYRNEYGTRSDRQSQMFLGRWNQPYQWGEDSFLEESDTRPKLLASVGT